MDRFGLVACFSGDEAAGFHELPCPKPVTDVVDLQALDIDGVTNLTGTDGLEPGAMVNVEITDALDYDLIGQVVR